MQFLEWRLVFLVLHLTNYVALGNLGKLLVTKCPHLNDWNNSIYLRGQMR